MSASLLFNDNSTKFNGYIVILLMLIIFNPHTTNSVIIQPIKALLQVLKMGIFSWECCIYYIYSRSLEDK